MPSGSPDRGQAQADGPNSVSPFVLLDEEGEHQDQRTRRRHSRTPRRSRRSGQVLPWPEARQHGVGEDHRKFGRDQAEPEGELRKARLKWPGTANHRPQAPSDIEDREDGDEALARRPPCRRSRQGRGPRIATISPVGRNAVAPDRLRGRSLADQVDDIGREDEGQKQGEIGLGGPEIEEPAPDAAPLGRVRPCLPLSPSCRIRTGNGWSQGGRDLRPGSAPSHVVAARSGPAGRGRAGLGRDPGRDPGGQRRALRWPGPAPFDQAGGGDDAGLRRRRRSAPKSGLQPRRSARGSARYSGSGRPSPGRRLRR